MHLSLTLTFFNGPRHSMEKGKASSSLRRNVNFPPGRDFPSLQIFDFSQIEHLSHSSCRRLSHFKRGPRFFIGTHTAIERMIEMSPLLVRWNHFFFSRKRPVTDQRKFRLRATGFGTLDDDGCCVYRALLGTTTAVSVPMYLLFSLYASSADLIPPFLRLRLRLRRRKGGRPP